MSQVTKTSMSAAFQQEDVSSYQNRSMSAAFQHEEVSSYQNRSMSAAFQHEDSSYQKSQQEDSQVTKTSMSEDVTKTEV